jgi:Asp-tRNA(Asn)/Glu-tRNA(Gln) amidotransferase A subunit family amidase
MPVRRRNPSRNAVVITAHLSAQLDERAQRVGIDISPADAESRTWSVAKYGRERTASDYGRAIRAIHPMGRALGRLTSWDLLLTPTMCDPTQARHSERHELDNASYLQALLRTMAFTAPFNSSGHPAMSVPLYFMRAYYFSYVNQHLHELSLSGGQWQDADLTAQSVEA